MSFQIVYGHPRIDVVGELKSALENALFKPVFGSDHPKNCAF
jgi:hypothetical protein